MVVVQLSRRACENILQPFSFSSKQVHELFSKSGDVKRIIIGLDKVKKTACGFCFVEYPFYCVYYFNMCLDTPQNELKYCHAHRRVCNRP